ncbi:MAG: TRAP transporter substrate-binding protein DctP [Proteobacteria bacterium]|nr:TRAP transporter substrate-binding protein DctP [Pseudomonadota bacterium]
MRRISVWCLAAALFLTLANGARAGGPYLFKSATLAPRGIGWAQAWEDILVPALSRATHGELKWKVYYGGIMGDDEDYIRKMRIGQLQSASITGQGAILACPEMTALELPFLFEDYGEVDYVRPFMYPVFDEMAARQGFKLLYWFEQDFDQIYSIARPMDSLEAFSRSRMVTWYGPVEEHVLNAMGAKPIPINGPEVPSALRQGIVDAVIAPAIWVVGSQTYNLFKYVNPMKIRYAPGLSILTLDAWNSLPLEYRTAMEATRRDALEEFIAVTRKANADALAAVVRYGLKSARMSPGDMDAIRARCLPVWDELAGTEFPVEILDRLKELLAQYRAGKN